VRHIEFHLIWSRSWPNTYEIEKLLKRIGLAFDGDLEPRMAIIIVPGDLVITRLKKMEGYADKGMVVHGYRLDNERSENSVRATFTELAHRVVSWSDKTPTGFQNGDIQEEEVGTAWTGTYREGKGPTWDEIIDRLLEDWKTRKGQVIA
jgi:hypothetical protein